MADGVNEIAIRSKPHAATQLHSHAKPHLRRSTGWKKRPEGRRKKETARKADIMHNVYIVT